MSDSSSLNGTLDQNLNESSFTAEEYNYQYSNSDSAIAPKQFTTKHGEHFSVYIFDFLTYTDATDQLATYALPSISSLSFFLNLITLLALTKTFFNGSLYKYIFFNTIFDLSTLMLVILKPLLKFLLTEDVFKLYFYIYLTSVGLMCSNLTKLIYSFERLTKMTGKFRYIFKKSHSVIILTYTIFSMLVNLPLLFEYFYFDVTWFKQTYFELTLNSRGIQTVFGILGMLNVMLLNLGIYVLIILVNILLKQALKENLKKLAQLIEIEKSGSLEHVTINIMDELEDKLENEDDESEEIDFESVHSQCITHRNVHTKIGDLESQIGTVSSSIGTCEEAKSPLSKRKMAQPPQNPIEIEKARRKMCNMVIYTNGLFIGGHTIFVISSLYEQLINIIYGKEYKKDYEDYGIQNFIANIILFLSMGFNFFIYLYYVRRFRQVIINAFVCSVCSLCCTIDSLKRRAKKKFKN
jgi:hypothetical protein